MNEIQIFNNSEFGEVRTLVVNNEPYFVGKDVAAALGYERPAKAILDHVDDEDKDEVPIQDSIGRMQNTPIINESGLYSLILSSKLPNAKKFKRWVTNEVLPSIRKNGSYSMKKDDHAKILEIKEMNARARLSNQFIKLSKVETLSAEYKNILVAKATEVLTGTQLLPLPKSKQKTYSATELGEMFGVSKQKIGSITTKYNLKTNEYGEYYRSKSLYSTKEVDTFVYFDSVIPVLESILGARQSVR